MKNINIFLSYSNTDKSIAAPLSNLIQEAFRPVIDEVFLDDRSIGFGAEIKESVGDALKRADILIAIVVDATPGSVISWPGFEIGRFLAFWEPELHAQGAHASREKKGLIGKVVTICNKIVPLGPIQGTRAVNLGISDDHLSVQDHDSSLEQARQTAAISNTEMLDFLREIEKLVANEREYIEFKSQRNLTLNDLVKRFKVEVFDILRRNVRSRSKPTKQLLIRTDHTSGLMFEDCTISSISGGVEAFGLAESNSMVFKRISGDAVTPDRYETSWRKFKDSVSANPYGAYWCAAIAQAVDQATKTGGEIDPNLILISRNGTKYRIIITTITRYFNNNIEISLYLVESLRRTDFGDPVTSKLLNCLTILCRFRFAFLEGDSPYYWINFEHKRTSLSELLMELDYLRSEAANTNLDNPGAFEDFIDSEELTTMMSNWSEIENGLRLLCSTAANSTKKIESENEIRAKVVSLLKKLSNDMNVYNAKIGVSVATRLLAEFENDIKDSSKRVTSC